MQILNTTLVDNRFDLRPDTGILAATFTPAAHFPLFCIDHHLHAPINIIMASQVNSHQATLIQSVVHITDSPHFTLSSYSAAHTDCLLITIEGLEENL